jgi:hypothetical protein
MATQKFRVSFVIECDEDSYPQQWIPEALIENLDADESVSEFVYTPLSEDNIKFNTPIVPDETMQWMIENGVKE